MRLHAIQCGDGDENLWGNVVVQALREAVGEDRGLRALAIRWIERRENRPGGFDWCCQCLGLQVERLREIVQWEPGEANRRWGVGGAASTDNAFLLSLGVEPDRVNVLED